MELTVTVTLTVTVIESLVHVLRVTNDDHDERTNERQIPRNSLSTLECLRHDAAEHVLLFDLICRDCFFVCHVRSARYVQLHSLRACRVSVSLLLVLTVRNLSE